MNECGKRKLKWINTLRGLAALFVLLEHILLYVNLQINDRIAFFDWITFKYVNIGKIGVALFFLISGYLTPLSIKRRSIPSFIFNRVKRLYPMYWVSILMCGVFLGFSYLSKWQVIVNFSMLQSFFGVPNILGIYWTLPIELLLYLLLILIRKYLWEESAVKIVSSIAMMSTVFLSLIRRSFWSSCPVAIGLLICSAFIGHVIMLYSNKMVSKKSINQLIIFFELTVVISSVLGYGNDLDHLEYWISYVVSYTIALFLFLLFSQKDYFSRVFDFVGEISYELYLFQEIINTFVFEKMYLYIYLSPMARSILSFFGSIFVAFVFHKLYMINTTLLQQKRLEK